MRFHSDKDLENTHLFPHTRKTAKPCCLKGNSKSWFWISCMSSKQSARTRGGRGVVLASCPEQQDGSRVRPWEQLQTRWPEGMPHAGLWRALVMLLSVNAMGWGACVGRPCPEPKSLNPSQSQGGALTRLFSPQKQTLQSVPCSVCVCLERNQNVHDLKKSN